MLSERLRKYWEITSYDELADEVAKYERVARAADGIKHLLERYTEGKYARFSTDGIKVECLIEALADLPEDALK